jgi:hypothetical protein
MKNSKIANSKITKQMKKRAPELLVATGLCACVTSVVLGIKATPKALLDIEREKLRQDVEKLTAKETVKIAWKHYVPCMTTIGLGVGAVIGAQKINAGKIAAMTAAIVTSETTFSEYKAKAKEMLGQKKEKEIVEAVHQEKVIKNPPTQKNVIVSKGSTTVYDSMSDRYWDMEVSDIKKAENNINAMLLKYGTASLNDLYDEFDMGHTTAGELLEWNIDQGFMEIEMNAVLIDDCKPCISLSYTPCPCQSNHWK